MKSAIAAVLVTGRSPLSEGDSHTSYVRAHAYAATRAGFDVHVVCLARTPRTEIADYGAVHAIATPLRCPRQTQLPLHSHRMSSAIVRLVHGLGARRAILHGFGVWGHPLVAAKRKLRADGVDCVSVLSSYTTYRDEIDSIARSLSPAYPWQIRLGVVAERAWIHAVIAGYERQAYRDADQILVNYKSVRNLVQARFGADVNCRIVPYSIEQEFATCSTPPALHGAVRRNPPVIVAASQHHPRKGIEVLLHALADLKRTGVTYAARLLSGGVLIDQHRSLLHSLELEDRVQILGRVPEVAPYFASADVFVLPSREEQSGSLALIEAMGAGLACVASGCDGIPEDISDGEDALITVPGDATSLAEAIATLISDADLRAALGLAARATFERKFSSAGLTRALAETYAATLARRPVPA